MDDKPTKPKRKKSVAAAQDLLALNPNEGRFLNVLPLPPGGWFNFGEHGNPPYDIPVEVRFKDNLLTIDVLGIRTRVLGEDPSKPEGSLRVSEKWILIRPIDAKKDNLPPSGLLTHWRPRQDAPDCPLPLRIEPKPPGFFKRIRWLLFG